MNKRRFHTNSSLIQDGIKKLKASNIISAGLDTRIILSHVTSQTPEELVLKRDETKPLLLVKKFFKLIESRANHEPIAYIIGHKEFYGIDFKLNKNVLIPRPDSETLIDLAKLYFNSQNKFSILDLGTGSGCLLLTLLHIFPNAKGTAIDISSKALRIAKQNAIALQLNNRTSFIKCDWSNLKLKNKFNFIISNPPYIKNKDIATLAEGVKNFEPLTALEGGQDGQDCYRKIFLKIKNYLEPNGICIFEIGKGQFNSITKLAEQHGFKLNEFKKDLSGIIRAVSFTPYR
jgi:release factor glutamine methyltransferase